MSKVHLAKLGVSKSKYKGYRPPKKKGRTRRVANLWDIGLKVPRAKDIGL
jgi:hypothetical protein